MAVNFDTLQRVEEARETAPGPLVFDFASAKKESTGVDFSSLSRVDKGDPDIEMIIRDAAKAEGLDETTLLSIAQVESALDPKAQNPNSSAGGLFQFIDDTWKDVAGEGTDRFDPNANAKAGAEFTKRNIAGLKETLGRDPTLEETYMAHFLGLAGARNTLKAMEDNPNALAKDVFSSVVRKANKGIFKEGMTARDAMKGLTNKVLEASKKF